MADNSTIKFSIKGRETARKSQIHAVLESSMYQGKAVILDELRWHVMGDQLAQCADDNKRRSLLNSFARTIREQLTHHVTQKVQISDELPVGLVARVAVFRLRDQVFLRRFLGSDQSCVLCRYKTNYDAHCPRYQTYSQYVTPQHYAATFRFFDRRPSTITYDELSAIPGAFIPATQKLTVIVPNGVAVDLASVAVVPWKLYGYTDLADWHPVKDTDNLEAIHRNRYF